MTFKLGLHPCADFGGAIKQAQREPYQYLVAKRRQARIPAEPVAQRPLSLGVAVLAARLQARQRLTVLSGIKLQRAEQAVADQVVGRLIQPLGDFDDLTRQIERRHHARPQRIAGAKAVQDGDALQIRATPFIQHLFRLREGFERFRADMLFSGTRALARATSSPSSMELRAGPGSIRGTWARPALA